MATPASQFTVPPRPSAPFWRRILAGYRDPLQYLEDLRANDGDFVMIRKNRLYLLAAPDGVQRVVQENHPNYGKGKIYHRAISPLQGNGLVTLEGSVWHRRRRAAQPAFLRKSHDVFAELILGELAQFRDRLMVDARASRQVDLAHILARSSLAIAFRTLFTDSLQDRAEELTNSFYVCEEELKVAAALLPFYPAKWMPTPSAHRFRKSLRVLDDFVFGCIAARRDAPAPPRDLLTMYMESRNDEAGEVMDDQALRDEMITLLAAGHNTLTAAISWTLYLLMTHLDIYARVVAEIDQAVGERTPSLTDLESLPLLRMTLQESMRLYPPIWGFMRTALHEDVVCGYRIPAGAMLMVVPYLTHRSPALWDDPQRFDPERFLPERSSTRHRFAYYPFGAGPRQCLGMGLAMMEAQFTLAILLQAFHMRLVPGQTIRPRPRISLGMAGPLLATLTPR